MLSCGLAHVRIAPHRPAAACGQGSAACLAPAPTVAMAAAHQPPRRRRPNQADGRQLSASSAAPPKARRPQPDSPPAHAAASPAPSTDWPRPVEQQPSEQPGQGRQGVPQPLASHDSVHEVMSPLLDGDLFKEQSRQYRRTWFDHKAWRHHRSTARYVRHTVNLPKSRMVWGLVQPLAYVLFVTLAVACYHEAAERGLAPVLWPDSNLDSGNAFGLSSFALSLLLVFRTNSSYGRWLDARRAWTTISARSKDFARQALAYIPEEQPQLHAAACRWVCAYSRALMCALRDGMDLRAQLRDVLPPHELDALLAADNRPAYALQVLSQVIATADLPLERRSTANVMDGNLTQLQEQMATCFRILHFPIPLSYTRHTSRFMLVWLTVLPFTVWETYRWVSLPICGLIAFLLLGIEEIGVQIEEPFSILPLEHTCEGIDECVSELYATHSGSAWAGFQAGNEAGVAGPLPAAALVKQALEVPAAFPAGHGSGGHERAATMH